MAGVPHLDDLRCAGSSEEQREGEQLVAAHTPEAEQPSAGTHPGGQRAEPKTHLCAPGFSLADAAACSTRLITAPTCSKA